MGEPDSSIDEQSFFVSKPLALHDQRPTDCILTATGDEENMLDTTKRTSVYQPEQEGLIFSEAPTFVSHAEECQYLKQHLGRPAVRLRSRASTMVLQGI